MAVSFFLLAPYIVVVAMDHLLTGNASGVSWLGIALAATDVVLMPVLRRAKQTVGRGVGSYATTSEGRQSIRCAYLSLAVLAGLGANALFGWWWADPIVALAVALVVIQAGAKPGAGRIVDALAQRPLDRPTRPGCLPGPGRAAGCSLDARE